MRNAPICATELNCQHCGWPLIKNGKLKCPRGKKRGKKHEVEATLGEKAIFCPLCRNPRILLAKHDLALCHQCRKETPMIQEEKVEKKKFREVRDWDEFLRLWEKNDIESVAEGLLDRVFGTIDHCERLNGQPTKRWLEEYRFHLNLAKSYQFPFDQSFIGDKALKNLIRRLNVDFVELGGWWRESDDPEYISFFEELVDFLAKEFSGEYCERLPEVVKLVESFWTKPEYYQHRGGPKIHKKFLADKKEALVKILLALKDYEFLYKHNLLKAPQFKEKTIGGGCR